MKRNILALGLMSLILTACQEQHNDSSSNAALMKVSVVQPQAVEFARTLQLAGSWVAKEDIAISPALQGQQILSVEAEVGSHVKQGQVLAVLEPNNVQSQLQQNNALLTRAKAER
ncbi:biotin/lipoyl-binding protein [Conservatibacter flavescens]|uniref:Uncharacterized protein n=1 Tax=Conservatibacter flavescens TaxID=28161 RepID=A0A2M8S375_9PAST|nr:biotin/lipoyl-binding protein [Conservatibacter flavescens]PJG85576.1 hypothetical protein CVP05_05260 [Conservatibacter flavescens]